MIYELSKGENAENIFSGWNETIIWSCLQGVMGHIYADHIENPSSAMAILGDFCFFAGQPSEELVAFKPVWCRDLVSQFADWEAYQSLGLGVVIRKDGVIVSGASSYSSYLGGIEIEIDTREEYRRRGLASICGAMLILECLDRGLYPSWDAQNLWSVALAEKLGYHLDYQYAAYEIYGY